jgi:hypothetical protein
MNLASVLKQSILKNKDVISSFPLLVALQSWVSMYVLSANRIRQLLPVLKM